MSLHLVPAPVATQPAAAPCDDPALAAALAELRAHVDRRTAGCEGPRATAIAGLHLHRLARPGGPKPAMQRPAFAMILQGRKRLELGADVLAYDARHYLVSSLDLPVIATVTTASEHEPYLGLRLDLDLTLLGELLQDERLPATARDDGEPAARAAYVAPTGRALAEAVLRLLRLLDTPEEIGVLAPMVQREILFRLLMDGPNAVLRHIAQQGSPSRRIAAAIRLLRERYAEPLRMDALAREVHLSVSALHHQFKAATSISPLQYQKQLRLQEARRLMLAEDAAVGVAALRVGYESASQFSRDYVRTYGRSPTADRRRWQAGGADVA